MGDLHGSIHSLLRNLQRLREAGYFNDDWTITERKVGCFRLCFLGDLVDRGPFGAEVWLTIMQLVCSNPAQVDDHASAFWCVF